MVSPDHRIIVYSYKSIKRRYNHINHKYHFELIAGFMDFQYLRSYADKQTNDPCNKILADLSIDSGCLLPFQKVLHYLISQISRKSSFKSSSRNSLSSTIWNNCRLWLLCYYSLSSFSKPHWWIYWRTYYEIYLRTSAAQYQIQRRNILKLERLEMIYFETVIFNNYLIY